MIYTPQNYDEYIKYFEQYTASLGFISNGNVEPSDIEINRRKWLWLGHTMRNLDEECSNMDWNDDLEKIN